MKLVRYGNCGEEKPGILDKEGQVRDLSDYFTDWDAKTLDNFDGLSQLHTLDFYQLPIIERHVRLGACVDRPGKIICVGFNSKLHAEELGLSCPTSTEIVVFLKPLSAMCGPFDPIFYTPNMKKLDWEAELGVVIGKKGKYISEDAAHEYILGYTCINDLSERYLQLETQDKQFTKCKGFDRAAPIGPYLVTKDEIEDANNLQIKLWVNGCLRQDFNTKDYIHNVTDVVSYISQYFTLYPGDIISMGSAPGSARSWGADCFLKPHDRVVLSIEGLGQQEQEVIIEPRF
jgi:2-keto-4-pentenoate hydratase/2-oxohepta-3-ene-1,7-dioic acid hydratase in catechol pathway